MLKQGCKYPADKRSATLHLLSQHSNPEMLPIEMPVQIDSHNGLDLQRGSLIHLLRPDMGCNDLHHRESVKLHLSSQHSNPEMRQFVTHCQID